MPPKRKRASSSKDNAADDVKVNSNNPFEQRLEELLITISREVSDLKNENKTIKETIFEMKNEMKNMKEVVYEMNKKNDYIKHTVDEMKCTMDKELNPTPLWKLVTEWKDVFEKEVLTKLDRLEQKMFSQACRASREAIKRAKIRLIKKFWIYKLSSISQLELAWANYEWGSKGKYSDGTEYTKNQEQFCMRVAHTNDLALLRWVRGVKECAWNWRTSGAAARIGNLEMLKYCVENGCKVHNGTCATAAKYGNLDCLKYLHEKNVKWDHQTVQLARENNHVECLNYALANNCPQTLEEWQALQAEEAEEEEEEEEEEEVDEENSEEEEEEEEEEEA
jgi:hypothetical protein